MKHQVDVTHLKDRQQSSYYLARCRTCVWERAAGTKHHADKIAVKHETTGR